MQFFKSAAAAIMVVAAVAVANPAPAPGESACKLLLEPCVTNSECCSNLCVGGVNANELAILINEVDIFTTVLRIDYADTQNISIQRGYSQHFEPEYSVLWVMCF